MNALSQILGRFRRAENGSTSIEFVFLFPIIISIFLIGFESGYFMVRNVMLERAVDIAVRDVRLGNGRVPSFTQLKADICNNAGLLPDCVNSLQVEMREVAITPGSAAAMDGPTRCVDRMSTEDSLTGTTYDVGRVNAMVILRVCSLQQPLFPTTVLGAGMGVDSQGNYALVTTTAFVTEPGNRALAAVPGDTDGDGIPDAPGGDSL